MGTQITNTLSGQTSGTIVTVDYSSDFTQLVQSIDILSSRLETLNTTFTQQNTTFNTFLETNLSGTTGSVTVGTIPNALKAMHSIMANQDSGLSSLNTTLGQLGQAIAGTDSAFGGVTGQLAIMNATNQIMVAETAQKNAFDQAATQAALERNGLPPVEVPQQTVEQQITRAVETASSVGIQSSITGFVSTQITAGFSYVGDIIDEYITGPIFDFVGAKWTQIKAAFAANNAEQIAAEEARTASSAATSSASGGTPAAGA